ncbi:hypothetical protein [Liquorilactobacillus satsumensis]|uniref:hypothetical protein n=1 Tax=Liquorilactobacillus satsumensis TaxID=259059 RepID=UPI0039E80DAD
MTYWLKRVKNYHYYYGFALGLLIICLHIFFSVIPARKYLTAENVFLFTPYTKWIYFNAGSGYSFLFVLALPLFCSLGLNQLIYDDLKSGFWHYKLIQGSLKRYSLVTSLLSFVSGFAMCGVLLLLDLGLTFLLLPNVKPDFILNANAPVLPQFTFFSNLYYSHPLVLFFAYIIFSSFVAGLFSLFSGMLSFYIRKKFAVVSTGFVIGFVLTILATVFTKQIYSPLLIISGYNPVYNPPLITALLGYLITLILVEVGFVLGVHKNAAL